MQISAINGSQSFKGLWGQPSKMLAGNEYTSLCYTTKPYYPFKDESKEVISSVVGYNRSSYQADWYETGGTYVDEKIDVEVKKALNFTEKEFSKYKMSGIGAVKPEEIVNPVEKELVDRGLYSYLNQSQKYINEINWRASFGYKFLNFVKNIGKKIKVI